MEKCNRVGWSIIKTSVYLSFLLSDYKRGTMKSTVVVCVCVCNSCLTSHFFKAKFNIKFKVSKAVKSIYTVDYIWDISQISNGLYSSRHSFLDTSLKM